MNDRSFAIVGIGELLFDLLPGGKQLGGAPANFAYHAAALGDRGLILSRVGSDALGEEIISTLALRGLETNHLQIDAAHPTGTVQVKLDVNGQPDFTIIENTAWDNFEWTEDWEALARVADAVCFGTLAQRTLPSRQTIQKFLPTTRSECVKIFDVNLRQSYYSEELLVQSLRSADVVKLNDQEIQVVKNILALSGSSEEELARDLLNKFALDLVCVTRGARGSLFVTAKQQTEHPGFPVAVADAVGAGDAFTAALAHHYLRGSPLELMSEAANLLGSWVASQVGAMPPKDPEVILRVRGE
ncbi:MAG: sugar kinase, ribokinase family [Candidatus Magasanikbacteria bacterium]|nr:sugar kinase, ribokinase family [Candidatus Magasanikbacteria bacterium]